MKRRMLPTRKGIAYVREGCPVALRHKQGVGSVGGYVRTIGEIEQVVDFYFGKLPVARRVSTAKNKVRFDFPCSEAEYRQVLGEMAGHGLVVKAVETHGRLMR